MGGVGEVRDVHLHPALVEDLEHGDHGRACEVVRDFKKWDAISRGEPCASCLIFNVLQEMRCYSKEKAMWNVLV